VGHFEFHLYQEAHCMNEKRNTSVKRAIATDAILRSRLELRANLTRQMIDMSNGTAHAIVIQPKSVGYSLTLLFPPPLIRGLPSPLRSTVDP
jgi:hypothetical protein